MHRNTKVATCCYCNTRAALVLDSERHELVCRSCGAPLHNLKSLPTSRPADAKHTQPKVKPHKHDKAHRKEKKPKKRKSTARWFLEEAVDLLDDIFD